MIYQIRTECSKKKNKSENKDVFSETEKKITIQLEVSKDWKTKWKKYSI